MSGAEPPKDLLSTVEWRLIGSLPGEHDGPGSVPWPEADVAVVPGSVAMSLRTQSTDVGVAAGPQIDGVDIDGLDWWYATDVEIGTEQTSDDGELIVDGISTLWTLWWDDEQIAQGQNMFRSSKISLPLAPGAHRLALVCRSLDAAPAPRKPRAQWRSNLLDNRFRWFRTAAFGRIAWPGAAPVVGPWLGLRLSPTPAPRVLINARESEAGGRIDVRVGEASGEIRCRVSCGDQSWTEARTADGGAVDLELDVGVPARWWPHGYGPPAHYRVRVELDGRLIADRLVGFRDLEVDQKGGGYTLIINGRPVFARGACWVSVDPLDLAGNREADRAALLTLREGGANTIRITGTGAYLPAHFHELCVELGLMVWHDLMLHTLAPPEDEAWLAEFDAEIREQLTALSGMPHVVVISGGSETEQQPTLWGLGPEKARTTALDETVPAAIAKCLPSAAHVVSSPTGGWRPTSVSQGISHYFGVGAYELPLTDARHSGVRFAAECLAFGVPPERPSVRAAFGEATTRDDPAWRRGIAKDPVADWDFEQTLIHYAEELFGLDIASLRSVDSERALDILRATAAHVFATTGAEWRRPASSNAGALVLSSRDLLPGAGWGLVDAFGEPKASWHGLRQAWLPRTILLTDEGLDSIAIHLVNDEPEPWVGQLTLTVSSGTGVVGAPVVVDFTVVESQTFWAEELLGGFRDLNHAWHFGPPGFESATVTATDSHGDTQTACMVMPHRLKQAAHQLDDSGLSAELIPEPEGSGWVLRLTAERTCSFVVVEAAGFRCSDQWFHLGAGTTRELILTGGEGRPSVEVRCLDGRPMSL